MIRAAQKAISRSKIPGGVLATVLIFCLSNPSSSASQKTTENCTEFIDPLKRLNCFDDLTKRKLEKHTVQGILDEIIDSPPAMAAIFAAVLALIGGIGGPLVQLKIGKRQAAAAQTSANAAMLTAQNAGTREIARMRLSWMDKVRDVLSEYHSILMSTDDDGLDEHARAISNFGTQIDLLLNRDDQIQRQLWEVADKIFRAPTLEERQSYDAELIAAGRAVFKAEWEKVKAEMRGQPFQIGA